MAALLKPFQVLKQPGQLKPNGVPRIDWTHPLARGLIFYAFDTGLGQVVELVSGLPDLGQGSTTQPTNGMSPFGAGKHFNGPSGFSSRFALTNIVGSTPTFTVANASFTQPNSNDYCAPFSVQGSNCYFATEIDYTDSILEFDAAAGEAVYLRPSFASANKFVSVAGTFTGALATFYCQGASVGTSSSVTSSNQVLDNSAGVGFGDYWLGSSGSASPFGIYGLNYYGAIWNRALSAAEILQLHLDPYCFLLPPEQEMPALFRAPLLLGDRLIAKQEAPWHPGPNFWTGIQGPNVEVPVTYEFVTRQEGPWHPSSLLYAGVQGPNVEVPVWNELVTRQELPDHPASKFFAGVQGPNVRPPIIDWLFLLQEAPPHPGSRFWAGTQGPNVRPPITDWFLLRQEAPWHPGSFFYPGYQFAAPVFRSPITDRLFICQEIPWHPGPFFDVGGSFYVPTPLATAIPHHRHFHADVGALMIR